MDARELGWVNQRPYEAGIAGPDARGLFGLGVVAIFCGLATLRHLGRGELRPIAARSLIGRSPACVVRVNEAHASAEHATLSFIDGAWELRDLGSTNGTFVDGQRIEPGAPIAVDLGSELSFGDLRDLWAFDDASPPSAVALDLESGEAQAATKDLLVLPSESRPEVSIYKNAADSWVQENVAGESITATDQSVILSGGRAWRLYLPLPTEETPIVYNGPSLETISLRLAVSSDEEEVQMIVIHRGKEIRLEAREHGYAILTLARLRLAAEAQPERERGWIDRDRLLKMLRMDASAFNVAVHRARQQLLAAGVRGAAGIVEVQRGLRRLGIDRVEIVPM